VSWLALGVSFGDFGGGGSTADDRKTVAIGRGGGIVSDQDWNNVIYTMHRGEKIVVTTKNRGVHLI